MTVCCKVGTTDGEDVGKVDGLKLGVVVVGAPVGEVVGRSDGIVVGIKLPADIGKVTELGVTDGDELGNAVGLILGLVVVGPEVGELVGRFDGMVVGMNVDGTVVGSSVGATVGLQPKMLISNNSRQVHPFVLLKLKFRAFVLKLLSDKNSAHHFSSS